MIGLLDYKLTTDNIFKPSTHLIDKVIGNWS